jgi:plastocyanin
MKRIATCGIGVIVAAAALALPVAAATQGVRVGSFYFEDSTSGDGRVTVDQGDRITFTFEGATQHTATVDGMFNSDVKSGGQTYTTATLTRAGTFTLYCQVHGAAQHATNLVIRPTAAPAPSPTTARPSPAPSRATAPAPTPKPTKSAQAVAPSPSRAGASPTRPSQSASPVSASAPASPTASPSGSASAAAVPPPAESASPSAEPAAAGGPADVAPAAPLDDGGGWLLPIALLLSAGVLAGGAIALGRRRRTG